MKLLTSSPRCVNVTRSWSRSHPQKRMLKVSVNDDNISEDEDEESQDIYDGTCARTRPAVLKGRRSGTLPPGPSSPESVGVMQASRPSQNQNQDRASEEKKGQGESPEGSPHDPEDIQQSEAEGDSDCQLEPGQQEDEIVAAQRNAVPPSGGGEGLVGPLVPAKKGTKRKRGPSKRKRTRGGMKKAPKLLSCYFCQKTFQKKQHLESHLLTHTKEAPFPCHICGKEFIQKGALNEHIRRHLKEKNFKCPHNGCSSSFVSSSGLRRHSWVHSGEKPFACPHPGCGKAFATSSNLRTHSRTHTGEKPFACTYAGCGKTFSHSSNLVVHSRIHSGEKPFSCPHPGCGKAFSHSSSLRTHSKTHSGKKPFACSFQGCGETFTEILSFARHRQTCSQREKN